MSDDDHENHDNEQQQEQEDTTEVELTQLLEPTKTTQKLTLQREETGVTSDDDSYYSAASSSFESSSESEEEDEGSELVSLIVNTRGGGRGAAKPKSESKSKSESDTAASMTSSVFNLVNNVAGAGILALSSGMTGGTGWIPAIGLCVVLGILSSHSFKIIGEACELTGEKDFKGLWARTIGPNTTYMVDGIIAFMCVAVSIIYSGILGDVFTPLLDQAGFPAHYNSRTTNILAITGALLLPLSLIKNLSALAFTSILGFSAIAYTVFFITFRALDGSYSLPNNGRFVEVATEAGGKLLEAMPSFDKTSLWGFGFTSLVLVSNLGLAFIAHYNAPVFYRQLRDTNSKRFGKMVDISFAILVLLYVITMTAGYSTFGDVCRGNLLLNYHPHDILSTLGRVATGFSILFGFPLVMCGARESLIGAAAACGWDSLGKDQYHFALVASMLAFVTAISVTVDDVSLVVGLTGAAMGAFIVYICPPMLYSKAVKLVNGGDSDDYKKAKRSLLLVPFGLFVGSLGVYMTIRESMS